MAKELNGSSDWVLPLWFPTGESVSMKVRAGRPCNEGGVGGAVPAE